MSGTTERALELSRQGIPFVQATVVRAQCPTSVRPGDSAIVLADGSVEGFVGGQCAEGSVRNAALGLLASGQPLLLRILPEGDAEFPESEGAKTVINPCLSGGAIEVFLEPQLPAARLAVVGDTPIAAAVEGLGRHLGFIVQRSVEPVSVIGSTAVIISTHGRYEEEVIKDALDAGVGLIGLVAGKVRGPAVLDGMVLADAERARIRTPIGLDIGAKTASEIALSILAEVVRAIRVDGLRTPTTRALDTERAPEVIDPVCGMTVVVSPDTPYLNYDGKDYWFCGPTCRLQYAERLMTAPEPTRS